MRVRVRVSVRIRVLALGGGAREQSMQSMYVRITHVWDLGGYC